jgi:hypothetical protein
MTAFSCAKTLAAHEAFFDVTSDGGLEQLAQEIAVAEAPVPVLRKME